MNRTLDEIIRENNKGLKNFTRGGRNRRGNRNRNRPQQRNDYDQRDNYAPRRVHNNRPRRDNYRPRNDNYRPRNDRMNLDRELTPRYERNNRQNRREYGFNNGLSKVSNMIIILLFYIRDLIEDTNEVIGETTEDKKDHLIIESKIQSLDQ